MIAEGEAFPALFNDKCADAMSSDIRGCDCKHYISIRLVGIGDKDLASV